MNTKSGEYLLLSLENTLRLNPEDIKASMKLVDLYDEMNKFDEKKKMLTDLFQLYPDDPEVKARYTVLTHLSDNQETVASKPRIDYFIIWGNGLKYSNAILEFIRSDKSFQIQSITNHKLENIEEFVFNLYKTDPVPWEHLVAKTRYLLHTEPEIIVIILKNLSPKEKFFGNGEFRHIQCEKIKIVKEILRNKYNPFVKGKRTEEHVIHASDYESQTEHLLEILNLGDLDNFKSSKNRFLEIPYHLPPIKNFTLKKIDIDRIHCSIITGELQNLEKQIIPITETPHYKYVNGNKSEYLNYYKKYGGLLLTDDHNTDSFDNLINEFNYARFSDEGHFIIVEQIQDNKYKIWDGVHRAAILKSNNSKTITAAVINKEAA